MVNAFQKLLSPRLKDILIGSLVNLLPKTNVDNVIYFPFYHSVLDDERRSFERQLKYMRNHGDFISLDDAIAIFETKKDVRGRYFCVTFDDGFKTCIRNALPILAENSCPAAFFLITDYVGRGLKNDCEKLRNFILRSQYLTPESANIEFMDWSDCKNLLRAGMTIGSHTCTHARLSELTVGEVKLEMSRSKLKIEEMLEVDCLHFCAPYGKPGTDLDIDVHTMLAKKSGYKSFFTASRGPNTSLTDPFKVKRDFVSAKWKMAWLTFMFRNNSKISYL